MTSHPLRLGFIGLGPIGRAMALRLLRAGHHLFVHAQGRIPRDIAESRATQCIRASGVAQRADIVFLMLPEAGKVEAVLFRTDGVAAGLSCGKVVVDLSGTPLLESQVFAQRMSALGCDYLAARACGDAADTRDGTLHLQVRGPAAAVERLRPLFDLIGQGAGRPEGEAGDRAVEVPDPRSPTRLACPPPGLRPAGSTTRPMRP